MTMEITYERDLRGARMLLPVCPQSEVGYPRRMILENTIRGCLLPQKRCGESENWYEYEISSLVSLEEYLEHHPLRERFLKQWVFMLCQTVTELGEYLLTEDFLYLTPETIYVRGNESGTSQEQFLFCLYPDERQDVKTQLRQLLKYLMEKTDRADDGCAVMCYELYSLVQKDNFCLREFMEALERWAQEEPPKEPEKKKRTKQLFASRRNSGIMKRVSR